LCCGQKEHKTNLFKSAIFLAHGPLHPQAASTTAEAILNVTSYF